MQVVSAKQIAKAIKLDKYGPIGTFIGWLFLKLTRISKLNRIYEKTYATDPNVFLKNLVRFLRNFHL